MPIPSPTFGPNGFVIPDESTVVLPAVQADINAAFGGNLNMADETPQGQLAVSQSAAIGNVNDTFLYYTQQVDPAYAAGRMQDAIGRIYFIERLPSRPTVVTVTCTGLAGVVIPVGATVLASDGNIYTCTQAGTISTSGSIDLSFSCNVAGPITCAAGSITTIYQTIPGWDTATNASDGVIGVDVETRQAFEQRRALSVAQNATGSLPAVLGAVLNVANVLDAFVTENVNDAAQVIGGVSLGPKSLYVCVVGGLASDVAKAIWTKKAPGCGYNGNTTVTVYDENPSYNLPYPAYSISFQTAISMTLIFAVSLSNSSLVPANAATLVQNAIISAMAGADGGPRARIGNTIMASRYYAPVAALGSWAQIVSIQIGCQNNASATFTASISGTTMTVTAVASGTIAIGQTVLGPNVASGTTITGGSGSTWTVSTSQTVASATLYGCLASNNEVTFNINQVPAASANDIVVTLS